MTEATLSGSRAGPSRSPVAAPDQAAALALAPRRVAGSGRRGRGISLLALAAAAAVVVFVLGLAALDAQRRDLPVPWGEQAAIPPAGPALTDPARPDAFEPGAGAVPGTPDSADHGS